MLILETPTRRRTPIGLDIGETFIRAVQLRRLNDRFVLTAAAQVERSAESKSRPDQLPSAIRAVLKQASFSGRAAVTALNAPEVEFHVLDLPAAVLRSSPQEAKQMVHFEIGRLSNEQPGNVETRHWPLPSSTGSTANAIGVSAGREAVVRLVDVCSEAGVSCSSVDASATALVRFGVLLRTWPGDHLWGILDIGARQTRLILCLGETPVLVRSTGAGGAEWTRCIAESLQLTSSAAELQKRAHGITLVGGNTRADLSRDTLRHEVGSLMLGALRSHLNDLAAEIKRSFDYALSCYPGRQNGGLVLVGGGSAMRNVREFLGAALGISVRRASDYLVEPECRLNYGTDGRNPLEVFAVAVGLAINE